MNTKHAFIDLGTNTFHLLVADINNNGADIQFQTNEIVGLGTGGINKNILTAAAIKRGINTINRFKGEIDKYKVEQIYAFGTSALRNASNSKHFIDLVLAETGINIEIIEGDKEAYLIYKGISAELFVKDFPYLIMDIGGGSTEFIIADGQDILWKKSFEVGVQRLVSSFYKEDPLADSSILEILNHLVAVLADLPIAIKAFKVKTLIGSSGTFTTLQKMFEAQNNLNHVNELFIPKQNFNEYYQQIISLPREKRILLSGMSSPRLDLIVMGVCIVKYVLNLTKLDGFYVSGNGLKEGALIMALKENL